MQSKTQLAYLAGIIDGEGTFYIGTSLTKNFFVKYNCRVYVVNTDEKLIDWLIENFGGLKYTRKSTKKWKTRFEWILDKQKIPPIINSLLPYLIIKKKHAEVMLKFIKTFDKDRDSRKVSKEILDYRSILNAQLKLILRQFMT